LHFSGECDRILSVAYAIFSFSATIGEFVTFLTKEAYCFQKNKTTGEKNEKKRKAGYRINP
jgi:hypothetical protein